MFRRASSQERLGCTCAGQAEPEDRAAGGPARAGLAFALQARETRGVSARLLAAVTSACTGCGACLPPCALRAVTLATERPDGFGARRAVVDARRCTGCGDCVAPCPHGAMVLRRRGGGPPSDRYRQASGVSVHARIRDGRAVTDG